MTFQLGNRTFNVPENPTVEDAILLYLCHRAQNLDEAAITILKALGMNYKDASGKEFFTPEKRPLSVQQLQQTSAAFTKVYGPTGEEIGFIYRI